MLTEREKALIDQRIKERRGNTGQGTPPSGTGFNSLSPQEIQKINEQLKKRGVDVGGSGPLNKEPEKKSGLVKRAGVFLKESLVDPLAKELIRPGVSLYRGLTGTTGAVKTPFGDVKPIAELTPREALGNAAGLATYAVGGAGASKVASKTATGLVQGVKTGAMQGLKTGALGGFASGLQDQKAGAGDVLSSTLGGAALGAGLGVLAAPIASVAQKAKAARSGNINKIAEYISPKVDTKLTRTALGKGSRGVENMGFMTPGKVKFTPREIEIAQTLRGVIDPKTKNPVKNIDYLNTFISDVSENQVTPFLKENPAIYNENLLRNKFAEIKKNKLGFLKNDKQSERIYDSIIDEALTIAKKQEKKDMNGLWRSRIDFDQWVERNFGDKVLKDDVARSARDEALRNVRNGITDFIAEHTPDNKFKEFMAILRRAYEAKDNIIDKAIADGFTKKSRLQLFAEKNPVKAKALKGAALLGGGAILGGVGKNLFD